MPVRIKKVRAKYRVVKASTGRIEKTGPKGKARDGGGSKTRAKVLAQVRAINLSIRRRRKR